MPCFQVSVFESITPLSQKFTDFVFGIGSRLGIAGKFQEVFTHYLYFRERNMRGAMGI